MLSHPVLLLIRRWQRGHGLVNSESSSHRPLAFNSSRCSDASPSSRSMYVRYKLLSFRALVSQSRSLPALGPWFHSALACGPTSNMRSRAVSSDALHEASPGQLITNL